MVSTMSNPFPKILSVTNVLPGEDAQWNRIHNMASLLRNEGFEVDIIHYVIKGGNAYKNLNYNYDEKSSYLISSPLTIFFKHVKKLFTGKYDLVYGNTFGGTFFCILGKIKRKPLILDMHGISEEYSMNQNLTIQNVLMKYVMKMMEKLCLLFSDKILCVSKSMMSYLNTKKGVPIEKLAYVPNGVDLNQFKPINQNKIIKLRKDMNINNKIVFGYLGGTQKWQGLENFISASKEITNDNFVTIIVGSNGPKDSRSKNLIYVPHVAKSEIVKYYSICDVLVLPRPKHEATEVAAPTKFAEYTAMNRPILTTNVGDAAKLVKSYNNGIVVENNDVANLKEGIEKFLRLNKKELLNMGNNSRKLAEKEFDWDNISIHILETFKSLNII